MTSTYRKPGLGKLSPEWEQFVKEFPVPPLIGTPEQLRAGFDRPPAPPEPVGFSITQQSVPGYGGYINQLRIYKPDDPPKNLAAVIYIHGGGWSIGSLDSEDAICRTICRENGVVVVSIDYRKAPENPFPTGVEDVWEGILWVFDNLTSLGGDFNHVLLGGLSAGANFTAALTHRAKNTKKVSFRGQILRVPLVVHPAVQPADLDFSSYKENKEAPVLPTEAVTQFLGWYNPVPEDLRMSPLLAEDFTNLPPAYVQIAGADPLRDDGFAYVEKLEKAG
ncbi:hypothetical protein G7Z17_g4727 [Cylindrodendrum hubeiense]|uniref:Alpha/beta hydrolase fold-3 domain-containing protein n=1 Tax=Cylindrodendrum hubeiense TaxID=595255 RepID=A0A9P5HFK8_9HYPO|nr:hypothetical protein G7Z17_g4727 [Cylindrodendrum hubeiense]